jgi:hypothetical protein
MSHPQHTISCLAYIRTLRERVGQAPATWFDVADAYDAGLYHGVEARDSAKRSLAELQARKETLKEMATGNTGGEHGA